MSRYHQRRQQRLQHPDIAAGYQEMRAELDLVQALDAVHEDMHITKEELAQRMGRKRESLSRVFNAEDANPTLETLTQMLRALGITAEIRLRKAEGDDAPIKVETAL